MPSDRKEEMYKDDELDGPVKRYDEKSGVVETVIYKDGEPVGVQK